MAMTINTNIEALNAQRNLGKTQSMLSKSLQRLSSGLRINSAKDDAAGLAISNRMTSQIRGLDQAVRNANDGISLAQTAEGALQESGNILQRIRELAIQASSDGSTDSDRASMQIEVDQLIAELDRIADTTSFNGQILLDGDFGTSRFQVGAEAGETVSMTMTSAKTDVLGSTEASGIGAFTLAKNTNTHGTIGTAGALAGLSAGALSIDGTDIRASLAGDDVVSSSDNVGSSIAIA
ncbi:MAG: flagellin, partial [Desulfobacterales bacterium]|nr:flagellin [Desulfobacterales bacterium]